ncbi:hypothetical protein PR048_019586 [Dryococelus australis]|uniref:Uncharacterized protein n=1 Tax=Dryococelus australis TaxID=614101 RepID=A0ABQ9H3Z5_9NEOP|nr:hypothetical protein PR048_019586 [Dryococelus australis]
MEERRNGIAGETGDPRENLPTSRIVHHDFHVDFNNAHFIVNSLYHWASDRQTLPARLRAYSRHVALSGSTEYVSTQKTKGVAVPLMSTYSPYTVESTLMRWSWHLSVQTDLHKEQTCLSGQYAKFARLCEVVAGCQQNAREGGSGSTQRKLANHQQHLSRFPLTKTVNELVGGATGAEWLGRSPSTKANKVQSPAGPLPNFHKWESCRTKPLVSCFLEDLPFLPALAFRRCSTLICSQELVVRMERRWNARAGEREIPEKTCRPAASSGTIPTSENPGAARPGMEPGSPWWEANSLTAQPPHACTVYRNDHSGLQVIAVVQGTELDRYRAIGSQSPGGNNDSAPLRRHEPRPRLMTSQDRMTSLVLVSSLAGAPPAVTAVTSQLFTVRCVDLHWPCLCSVVRHNTPSCRAMSPAARAFTHFLVGCAKVWKWIVALAVSEFTCSHSRPLPLVPFREIQALVPFVKKCASPNADTLVRLYIDY